jgi:hypothetical protein
MLSQAFNMLSQAFNTIILAGWVTFPSFIQALFWLAGLPRVPTHLI